MVFINILIILGFIILVAVDIYLYRKLKYISDNFQSVKKENQGYRDLQKEETSHSFYDY